MLSAKEQKNFFAFVDAAVKLADTPLETVQTSFVAHATSASEDK